MRKNLTTTHYKNGTPVTLITTDNTAWTNNTTGARCYYSNDSVTNKPIYGALYNWYAVNNANGLCPTGWHVPNHNEWTTLEKAVCTSTTCSSDFPYDTTTTGWKGTNESLKLKTTGSCTTCPNTPSGCWCATNNGTNSSGFYALPGGHRSYGDGSFYDIGYFGHWWTATAYDASNAWKRLLCYSDANVGRLSGNKAGGFSVRCVKDN